jgi:Leucine-rich repeat (LRR) protein
MSFPLAQIFTSPFFQHMFKRPKPWLVFPDDLWSVILQFFTESMHTWAASQLVTRQFRRCARKPRALAFVRVTLGQADWLQRLGPTVSGLDKLVLNTDQVLTALAGLSALRELRVQDIAPESIPRLSVLPKLQVLEFIHEHGITNQDVEALSTLTTLRTLQFGMCANIADLEPLSRLTSLSKLSLYMASVVDLTPLAALPLTDLALDDIDTLRDLSPLANMTTLRDLSLFKCMQIGDKAAADISSLHGLETLNLGHCESLTSAGIVSLAGLTSLKSLDLSNTGLSDTSLRVLCMSLQLEELLVACCVITSEGLCFLQNQRRLRVLDLGCCDDITELGPLVQLTQLRDLNLSDCEGLWDHSLSPLSQLVDLQKLGLRSEQLTQACLCHLRSLVSLQKLDVDFDLSDTGLRSIASLAALQKLTVCKEVTSFGLRSMSRLLGLQSLDLSNCLRLTDEGLSHLTRLKALHTLNLRAVPIADAGMAYVSRICSLTSLDLTDCHQITAQGLWTLEALEQLQELRMAGCVNVSLVNRGLPRFAKVHTMDLGQVQIKTLYPSIFSPALKALDLSACKTMIIQNVKWCDREPRLSLLRLARCTSIGLSCLRELVHLPWLRTLDLSDNPQVTDEHVRVVARLRLTTLDVNNCRALTDESLFALSTSPILTSLNVAHCDLITDAGLQSLTRLGLQLLDFSGCDLVTLDGTAHFPKRVKLRADQCAGWGPAAVGHTLIRPNPKTPVDVHANDVLRVSMLNFASKLVSKQWFFVSVFKDCTALHADKLTIGESAMLVQTSFDAVDWHFMAHQFASVIPGVHHRWYFFKEDGLRRIKVHARPLQCH